MVLSLNELPDGSALSAIRDIDSEFKKLRETAHLLKLPNPNSINWTLVVSSTSDSAATQKKINKLIEEFRLNDEEQFGNATADTIDLIENFCSMHLGVNLRKAFLNGVNGEEECNEVRKQHSVDVLVHEFCKLFGQHGVPEYTLGAQFFDFLNLRATMSTAPEDIVYYQACLKVTLYRQVGSRYFVSAANGCRILFLKNAAVEFFRYTGKNSGNKLEQEVFHKLHNSNELCHLIIDSLMYYHIYADLFMLSKSTDLDLSAFDMNKHYFELQVFLTEVI